MSTSVIVLGVVLTSINVSCLVWEYIIFKKNRQIYYRVAYKWRRVTPRADDKLGTVEVPTVRRSHSIKSSV